jgi:hypothetical protein
MLAHILTTQLVSLQLAYRLGKHLEKGFHNINQGKTVDATSIHLAAWTNHMVTAVHACRGHPTVIFPAALTTARATLEIGTSLLFQALRAAGEADRWFSYSDIGAPSTCYRNEMPQYQEAPATQTAPC